MRRQQLCRWQTGGLKTCASKVYFRAPIACCKLLEALAFRWTYERPISLHTVETFTMPEAKSVMSASMSTLCLRIRRFESRAFKRNRFGSSIDKVGGTAGALAPEGAERWTRLERHRPRRAQR
jgi:hypothetical protein